MAIHCNFAFIESDENELNHTRTEQSVSEPSIDSTEIFNCEQDISDDLELVDALDETKANYVGNGFNSQDSFELQEVSCISTKRFITPRALNNIYNQLTPVMNSATFVQKLQITECR